MDLSRKMTRSEFNELSEEDKKERKRLQSINRNKKWREENPEYHKEYHKNCREENKDQIAKQKKEYRENNKEQIAKQKKEYMKKNKDKISNRHKEYTQTPNGKKSTKLSNWKNRGLQETKEELDRIYDLYLNQELCNACDVKLTRNGDNDPTQAVLDHDHDTHKFRHIICRACNCNDSWKKYFC